MPPAPTYVRPAIVREHAYPQQGPAFEHQTVVANLCERGDEMMLDLVALGARVEALDGHSPLNTAGARTTRRA